MKITKVLILVHSGHLLSRWTSNFRLKLMGCLWKLSQM